MQILVTHLGRLESVAPPQPRHFLSADSSGVAITPVAREGTYSPIQHFQLYMEGKAVTHAFAFPVDSCQSTLFNMGTGTTKPASGTLPVSRGPCGLELWPVRI